MKMKCMQLMSKNRKNKGIGNQNKIVTKTKSAIQYHFARAQSSLNLN